MLYGIHRLVVSRTKVYCAIGVVYVYGLIALGVAVLTGVTDLGVLVAGADLVAGFYNVSVSVGFAYINSVIGFGLGFAVITLKFSLRRLKPSQKLIAPPQLITIRKAIDS